MRAIGYGRSLGFLLAVVLGARRAGAESVLPRPASTAKASRPNIVLILTDDQRFDTIGAAHAPDGSTPIMPRVASELVGNGVTFTNSFATTALCAPSRASLLSGKYAHSTGVHQNHGPHALAAFDESRTLATWLHDAGYVTGMFGKYVNGYEDVAPYTPPGWDDWHAFRKPSYFDYELFENGALVPYGHAAPDYSTDVLAARTVAFIRAHAGRTPFFAYFAPFAPHVPATPAPRHAGTLAHAPPWRPPNFDEANVGDKPAWVQALAPWGPDRVAQKDAFDRRQLECLRAVDDAVGAIMDALRETGVDRDTVVLYASDNGYAWGAHRWQGKECPYEECMRVPLVVRYPALVSRPRTDDRVVLNVDYAETLTQLAGAAASPEVQGASLVPLLDDTADGWRADFLEEHWHSREVPDFAEIRTSRWKYVEYGTAEAELYDETADPWELHDVARAPGRSDLVATLAARMRSLRPDWKPMMLLRARSELRAFRAWARSSVKRRKSGSAVPAS